MSMWVKEKKLTEANCLQITREKIKSVNYMLTMQKNYTLKE